MDIHPIVVHFPVALLSAFTAIQVLPPKKILQSNALFTLSSFLLLTGGISALIARQTGDLAAHQLGENALIRAHESWATAATGIYGILCVLYLVIILEKLLIVPAYANNRIVKYITSHTWFSPIHTRLLQVIELRIAAIASYIGFITLTVTGALGGAIVYGPDTDPIVKFIYTIIIGN